MERKVRERAMGSRCKARWMPRGARAFGTLTGLLFTAAVCVGCVHPTLAHAENYRIVITDHSFSPARITGRLNEPVTITIVNQGTKTHNFVLPAFYIFTANLPAKHTTNVGFSPDKAGSYPFFSDTGGAKEPGLEGHIDVR